MEEDHIQNLLSSEDKQYAIEKKRGERVAGSRIQAGLQDSVFFITGGSGFIGSQLIEKLLRSCAVRKVYLLLRAKKGNSVDQRLEKLLEEPVFNLLKRLKPDFHTKVVAVAGDVSELNLGLSDDDRKMVTSDTTCIIHAAATIRFDEPLKQAVLINVRGTREALNLGHECKNLRAYVHVSTAYVHIYKKEVHEKIYDFEMKPDTIISLVESMDDQQVDRISEGMIHGWPNTYTYTKTIAESAVQQYGRGLPVAIIRPAIVSSSFNEPCMGWLAKSNMYGPSGMLVGLGLGVIHVIFGNPDVRLEMVPVDFVNNLTIAAAWNTYKHPESDVKVYTLSSRRNTFPWRAANYCCERNARQYVTSKAIWYCYGWLTNSRIFFHLVTIFLHFIPAFFVDIVLKLKGSRIRLLPIYKKAAKLSILFSHFTKNEWEFYDDNTQDLYHRLSKDDKKIFCFDITTIDMMNYMLYWCLGIRKFVIGDKFDDTTYALRKQNCLKVLHYAFSLLYAYILYKLLHFLFNGFCYILGL